MADLVGVRGVPLAASTVIFAYITARVHQTDYAAVACSNNNQAQLHTHVLITNGRSGGGSMERPCEGLLSPILRNSKSVQT